jgi:Phytanoyl-CoA dioxygenase (PhyH)
MTEILKVDVPETELLDVEQVMKFACDGFVRLDRVVPEDLNRQVLGELDAYEGNGFKYWDTSLAIRKVFQLPQLCGALRSLMGPDPIYNHSFVHIVPARHPQAQDWHADSIIDTRPLTFDVLVMYFPGDTPREMGPTLVLPGSHLRDIRFGSIAHYRNIVGQQHLACSAGTVFITHSDIWHCAQPNSTDRRRYMFKMRLQLAPGREQRGWFNTEGYDNPDVLERIFTTHQPWFGAEHREEQIQRAKLWRYLCGSDRVDAAHGMLTRLGI